MLSPIHDNKRMSTIDTNEVSPDMKDDLDVIARCAARAKPVPPDVAERIRQRGERITEEIRRKFGLVDVAVPAIRELRGELPSP